MSELKSKINVLAKRALRVLFEKGQRIGLDILPRHFYSEIPNISELKKTSWWRNPYSMKGIEGASTKKQLIFLKKYCTNKITKEIRSRDIHGAASEKNGREGFGSVEADFLFAFVARKEPSQIFQIGCGVSTAVCLLAAEYAGYRPEVLCVDPYPNEFLKRSDSRGDVDLIQKGVEKIRLEKIENLKSDLLFFVDSTHSLGPSGEVTRIILEMLPRLKVGAHVHFHDINFPYDYGRGILDSSLFFGHEGALLLSFLTYNNRFRILMSQSMLHYSCPNELEKYLPGYDPAPNRDGLSMGDGDFPSSTYLRVI